MVPVVHHQGHQGHHRVKGDTADMGPLQLDHKTRRDGGQASHIVVDYPDVHPGGSLFLQDLLHCVPHPSGAYDEGFQEDKPLCLFQILQQMRKHGFAAGKILDRGVFPGGPWPVFGNIGGQLPSRGSSSMTWSGCWATSPRCRRSTASIRRRIRREGRLLPQNKYISPPNTGVMRSEPSRQWCRPGSRPCAPETG